MKVGLALGDAENAAVEAREAEDLGFDCLGSGEHLFFHVPTSNSLILLAAAAAATRKVRLISSVALLPLYPPALLAKLAVTLDQVSHGRLDLGLGAGGEYPPEFQAVGVDPATRFRRMDEGLVLLRRLFSGDRVSYVGEFTTLQGTALDPPPVQDGGPPLWLGGRKAQALRRAGRHADVWMPYMVDPDQLRGGLAQVRDSAAEHGRVPEAVRGALFAWVCVDDDADWARRTGIEAVSRTYRQDFRPLADRYLLTGAPEQVVARLREFENAGADTVLLQVATEHAHDRSRVIETLARAVLPSLKGR